MANVEREEPKKDSKEKRVNFDNTRESKYRKDTRSGRKQSTNPKRSRKRSGGKSDDQGSHKQIKSGATNDVSWYAQNGQMLAASASLSFYNTVGRKDGLGDVTRSVPGVMNLQWAPNVGGADNQAIRQAANQTYSFTVHANSRNYAYTPSDQMLLILAGASVFSAISLGLRAYGTLNQFSGQDMYTPNTLLYAMGFQYSDLRDNIAKIWFDINHLIAKTKQIWIPNKLPLIQRWFWMNAHVYTDAKSAKAQYYLFSPMFFWQYNETAEETGGSLTTVPWASEPSHTWQQYYDKVSAMIDALLNSEDRGIIFGDLLKAYTADGIYAISPIASDYSVIPVYDEEVLTQIENASILGFYGGGVVQDNAHDLRQQWNWYPLETVVNSALMPLNNEILNFHQLEQPTPEQIMVATRLKALGCTIVDKTTDASGDVKTVQVRPTTAGTEVIVQATMCAFQWSSGSPVLIVGTLSPANANNLSYLGELMMYWVPFDWAPWVYLRNTYQSVITSAATYPLRADAKANRAYGDYDNYVVLQEAELDRMHTAAVYSLLGIPQM